MNSPVTLITGAVGNLGFATAQTFQTAGHRTVLVDRSPDRLAHAFPGLVASAHHLLAGGVDLADPAALDRLVETVLARFGRVDILVHTVGAWRGGKPVHETDLTDWDFLLSVNLRTTLLCCRAVIPPMLRQQRGRIITVASRDGLAGSAGFAAYSASKSAVLRLNEALADELKASNLNVNCVLPSTLDTPQNRAAMPDADFRKWIEPAAVAEVMLFLASDAARAITGAALPVYGKG
ncbi:MAG: SDR family oxidoreductase [Verrucomicrobia bacterium]|nr:SDR family oxidoreductase [Verrucomicrobiota bacterium]